MSNEQSSNPMYISVGQTAKRLGVHNHFVYNLIKKNGLPCMKIGAAHKPVLRIPVAALEAWEAQQLENGGTK